MVQMIIDAYGRDAIAEIAAAWRGGAGDAQALEAGTGVSAEQLYADYFASFGVPSPSAVEPAPILPSNVDKPPQPEPASPQPAASSTEEPSPSSSPGEEPGSGTADATWLLLVGAAVVGVGIGAIVAVRRRRRPAGASS